MNNERSATTIACPRCQATLSLPEATPAAADVQCPVCKAEFAVAAARRPELPVARVVTRVAPPTPKTTPSYLDLKLDDLSASGVHVYEPGSSNPSPIPTPPQQTPATAKIAVQHAPSAVQPKSLDHYDDVDAELDLDVSPPAAAERSVPDVDPHAATVAISPGKTVTLNEQLTAAATRETKPAAIPAKQTTAPVAAPSFTTDPHAHNNEDDDANDDNGASPFAAGEFNIKPGKRRPRRKTEVVGMVGIVCGGVIGLLLGGYALLWIRGEDGDLFQMSRWLPPSLLPPSLQKSTASDAGKKAAGIQGATFAENASGVADEDEPSADQGAAGMPLNLKRDRSVTPATAIEPAAGNANKESAPAVAPLAVKWPVTPLIGDLRDVKLYSLSELAPTVAAGEQASKTFIAGDLSKREFVRPMGGAYIQLCALAEQFTLADPADYGSEQFTQLALAKAALRAVTVTGRRDDLAVIATRWVQHNRRQNQGAVFYGTVRDLRAMGPWTECQVEIAQGDNTVEVPVLLDRLKFNVGREVGVIGVIVADPQKHIKGYEGDEPQIVVAGDAFDPSTVVVEESSSEFLLPGE